MRSELCAGRWRWPGAGAHAVTCHAVACPVFRVKAKSVALRNKYIIVPGIGVLAGRLATLSNIGDVG